MSDDNFGVDKGEGKGGVTNSWSITRYPAVTDNLDTVFELLSDARCRYLLYYLFRINGSVAELDAAANAVYKYETACSDEYEDATRETIKISLHHNRLPQLEDAGIVDYDTRQGTIRFTEDPTVEEWIDHAHHKEIDENHTS